MFSQPSPRMLDLTAKLRKFVTEECIPREAAANAHMNSFGGVGNPKRFTTYPPQIDVLKKKARELGLWNCFLGKDYPEGAGLSNYEYASLCEIMGESPALAPEACNCSAPDTGNMEVLAKYGVRVTNFQYTVSQKC